MAWLAGGGGGSGGDTRSPEQKNRDAFRRQAGKKQAKPKQRHASGGGKTSFKSRHVSGDQRKVPTLSELFASRASQLMDPFLAAAAGRPKRSEGGTPMAAHLEPDRDRRVPGPFVARVGDKQGPPVELKDPYIVVPDGSGGFRKVAHSEQQANVEASVDEFIRSGRAKVVKTDLGKGVVGYELQWDVSPEQQAKMAQLAAIGVIETDPKRVDSVYRTWFERIERYEKEATERRLEDPVRLDGRYDEHVKQGQLAYRQSEQAAINLHRQLEAAERFAPGPVAVALSKAQAYAAYGLWWTAGVVAEHAGRPFVTAFRTVMELGAGRESIVDAARKWDATMPQRVTRPFEVGAHNREASDLTRHANSGWEGSPAARGRNDFDADSTLKDIGRGIAGAAGWLMGRDADDVDALYRYLYVTGLRSGEHALREDGRKPSWLMQVGWLGEELLFDATNAFDFGAGDALLIANKAQKLQSAHTAVEAAQAALNARRAVEVTHGIGRYAQDVFTRGAELRLTLANVALDMETVRLSEGLMAANLALVSGKLRQAADLANDGRSVVEALPPLARTINHNLSKPVRAVGNHHEDGFLKQQQAGARLVQGSLHRSPAFRRVAQAVDNLSWLSKEDWLAVATHLFGPTTGVRIKGTRMLSREALLARFADDFTRNAVEVFLDEWDVLSRGLRDEMSQNSDTLLKMAREAFDSGAFGALDTPDNIEKATMAFRKWVGGFTNSFEMVDAVSKSGVAYKKLIDLDDIIPAADTWGDNYLPLIRAEDFRGPTVVDLNRSAVYPWMRQAEGITQEMFMEQFGSADAILSSIAMRVRGNAQWQARAMLAEMWLDMRRNGVDHLVRTEFLRDLELASAGFNKLPAKAAEFVQLFFGLNDGTPERAKLLQDLWVAVRDPSKTVAERQAIVDTVVHVADQMSSELANVAELAEEQISLLRYAAGLHVQGDEAFYRRAADVGLVDYSGDAARRAYADAPIGGEIEGAELNPAWVDWNDETLRRRQEYDDLVAKGDPTAVATGYAQSGRAARAHEEALVAAQRRIDYDEFKVPVDAADDAARRSELQGELDKWEYAREAADAKLADAVKAAQEFDAEQVIELYGTRQKRAKLHVSQRALAKRRAKEARELLDSVARAQRAVDDIVMRATDVRGQMAAPPTHKVELRPRVEPPKYLPTATPRTRANATFRMPDPAPRRAEYADAMRGAAARADERVAEAELRAKRIRGDIARIEREQAGNVLAEPKLASLRDDLAKQEQAIERLRESSQKAWDDYAEAYAWTEVSPKHAGKSLAEIAAEGDMGYVLHVAHHYGKRKAEVLGPWPEGVGPRFIWVEASSDAATQAANAAVREQAMKVYRGFMDNVPPVKTRVFLEADVETLRLRGYHADTFGSRQWFDRRAKEFGQWSDDELAYVQARWESEAADRLHQLGLSRVDDPALFDAEVAKLVEQIKNEDGWRVVEVALDPTYTVADFPASRGQRPFIPSDRLHVWEPESRKWRALVPDAPEADPAALEYMAVRGVEDLRAAVEEAGRVALEGDLDIPVGEAVAEALGAMGYDLGQRAQVLLSTLATSEKKARTAARYLDELLEAQSRVEFADEAERLAELFRKRGLDKYDDEDAVHATTLGAELAASRLDEEARALRVQALDLEDALALDELEDPEAFRELVSTLERVRADAGRKQAIAAAQRAHVEKVRGLSGQAAHEFAEAARRLAKGELSFETLRAVSPADLEQAFGSALGGSPERLHYAAEAYPLYVKTLLDEGEDPLDIALSFYGRAITGETRSLLDALWETSKWDEAGQLDYVVSGGFRQVVIGVEPVAFEPEALLDGLQQAHRMGTFDPAGADVAKALAARADAARRAGRAHHAKVFAHEAAFDGVFMERYGVSMAEWYERQVDTSAAFSHMVDQAAAAEMNKVRISALRELQEQSAVANDYLEMFKVAAQDIAVDKPVGRWRGVHGKLLDQLQPGVDFYDTAMQTFRMSVLGSMSFVLGNVVDIALKNRIGGVSWKRMAEVYARLFKAQTLTLFDDFVEFSRRFVRQAPFEGQVREAGEVVSHQFVSDRVLNELKDGDMALTPTGRSIHTVSGGTLTSGIGTMLDGGEPNFLKGVVSEFFKVGADMVETFGRQALLKDAWDKAFGVLLKERVPHLSEFIDEMMALPSSRRVEFLQRRPHEAAQLAPHMDVAENEAFAFAQEKMLSTHFDYENLSNAQSVLKRFFMFPTYAIGNTKFWAKFMLANPQWLVRYWKAEQNEDVFRVPVGDGTHYIDLRYFLSLGKFVPKSEPWKLDDDRHALQPLYTPLQKVGLELTPVLSKMLQYSGAIDPMNYRDGVPLLNLMARWSATNPMVRDRVGATGIDIPRAADFLFAHLFDATVGKLIPDGEHPYEDAWTKYNDEFWREAVRQAAYDGPERGVFNYAAAEQAVADRELTKDALMFFLRSPMKRQNWGDLPVAGYGEDDQLRNRLFYSTFDLDPQVYVPDYAVAFGANTWMKGLRDEVLNRVPGWDGERRSQVKENYSRGVEELRVQFPQVFDRSPHSLAEEKVASRRARLDAGVERFIDLQKQKKAALGRFKVQAGPKYTAAKKEWDERIGAYLASRPDVEAFINRDLPGREAEWQAYQDAGFSRYLDAYFATSDYDKRDRIAAEAKRFADAYRNAKGRGGYDVLASEFPDLEQYLWAKATPTERRVQKLWYDRIGGLIGKGYGAFYAAYRELPQDVRFVVDAWRVDKGKAPYVGPGAWRRTDFGTRYPTLGGFMARRGGSFEEWWASYLALPESEQRAINAARRRKGKPPFPTGDAARSIDWGKWAEKYGIKGKGAGGTFHGIPRSVVDGYFNIPREMKHARREYLKFHPELEVAFEAARLAKAEELEAQREQVLSSMPSLAARVQQWFGELSSHVPAARVPNVGMEYGGGRSAERKERTSSRNRQAN